MRKVHSMFTKSSVSFENEQQRNELWQKSINTADVNMIKEIIKSHNKNYKSLDFATKQQTESQGNLLDLAIFRFDYELFNTALSKGLNNNGEQDEQLLYQVLALSQMYKYLPTFTKKQS